MNKDKVKGKVDQVKGEAKEQWGKLTEDRSIENEGKVDKAKGKLQEKIGQVKDIFSRVAFENRRDTYSFNIL
ncbi:CsbD family protein [Neobacillus sp. FSL H8-0543]|uniref:CsbD family protein n=1 Tax=Neobacillus sp. FSL H8-0543 TaxID=2954672 RepID=UPI003158AE2C